MAFFSPIQEQLAIHLRRQGPPGKEHLACAQIRPYIYSNIKSVLKTDVVHIAYSRVITTFYFIQKHIVPTKSRKNYLEPGELVIVDDTYNDTEKQIN